MAIQNFDFFDELTSNEQELLLHNIKPIAFESGTTLFFQGDTTQDILLLSEGDVRLYIQGEGINEITLYTLHPYEQCIVNTTSTLNQTPAIGSAITVSPIKGFMLNREIVKELMNENSNYQHYMFSLFTLRLDSVARVLESVKFKMLDERLFDWLNAQNKKIVEITHEELANYIGSTRVVVSRTLKSMEREGLIQLSRGKIEVL